MIIHFLFCIVFLSRSMSYLSFSVLLRMGLQDQENLRSSFQFQSHDVPINRGRRSVEGSTSIIFPLILSILDLRGSFF